MAHRPKGDSDALNPAEAQWRLESIIEATQVGTWEWNIQTGATVFNEAWAGMIGFTLDELGDPSVETWIERTHPDDLERANSLLQQHFAGELPYYECDLRMRHKDGHWVWVQDRGRIITRTPDGRPLLMFGAHIDITKRKVAEEALRKSQQQFFLSLEMASDAIYLIRGQEWIYANAAGIRLLGAEQADQLVGTNFFERIVPDYHAVIRQRVQDFAMPDTTAPRLRLQFVRLDGSVVDVESTATMIQLGNDLIREVVVRDITEDLRAERELKHSHDLMTYVIEHARSAVAVHDRNLNYVYVSQRYLEEYGVTERDVIGKNHYDVFPDLPQKWRRVHWRALRGEVLSAEDDPYMHDDGRVDWTRWECRPWYKSDGTIGGIIVYTEVINEQKRIEEQLIDYQRRLRALAAELVTSSEREQRRLAAELHDGVGQMLVAAKMEAHILGEYALEVPAQQSAERLAGLLTAALDEVRTMTVELAPSVLLGRGLEASLRWLAELYNERYGLRVLLRVDDIVNASSDETKMLIFRVVREGLNNVARHSQQRTATVTVRHPGSRTTVSVTDHGIGFDPAAVADPLTTRGFGLFSLQEECLARGSSLRVSSVPGKGTKISASVPDPVESANTA